MAPNNVRAFDPQTTSIELSWEFENKVRNVLGILTGFIIFYQMANNSFAPVLQYEVQDGNARQGCITGLDVYRFYKISVAGKTRVGHGVVSEEVYVRTSGTGLYHVLMHTVIVRLSIMSLHQSKCLFLFVGLSVCPEGPGPF